MNADGLLLIAMIVAAAPALAGSPKSFGVTIVVGLVSLPLLGSAVLAVPSSGYGQTLAGAVGLVIVAVVFASACLLRCVLLIRAARRRREAIADEPATGGRARASRSRTRR